MVEDEDYRTAVFGKTERTVGWEGDGEPAMTGPVRHCMRGNPQRTGRSNLKSLSHSFTLDQLFPAFQFADDGHPYPELKVILQRLPDRQGWDRLQWFLSPHESLAGAPPVEVWHQDRRRVVEASRSEHWEERL